MLKISNFCSQSFRKKFKNSPFENNFFQKKFNIFFKKKVVLGGTRGVLGSFQNIFVQNENSKKMNKFFFSKTIRFTNISKKIFFEKNIKTFLSKKISICFKKKGALREYLGALVEALLKISKMIFFQKLFLSS